MGFRNIIRQDCKVEAAKEIAAFQGLAKESPAGSQRVQRDRERTCLGDARRDFRRKMPLEDYFAIGHRQFGFIMAK